MGWFVEGNQLKETTRQAIQRVPASHLVTAMFRSGLKPGNSPKTPRARVGMFVFIVYHTCTHAENPVSELGRVGSGFQLWSTLCLLLGGVRF